MVSYQVGTENNSDEGLLHIPQTSGLEPHNQIQFRIEILRECFMLYI